jgi:hypothetical protein
MTIQLNPEEERLIGQAVQAGLIGKADDVVAVGAETIRQRLQSRVGLGSELNTAVRRSNQPRLDLRLQPHHPHCAQAERAVAVLRTENEVLHVPAQNLIEFWAVATRSETDRLSKNSLEMRRFQALARLKNPRRTLPKPLESLGMDKRDKRLRWRRLGVCLLLARKLNWKSQISIESGSSGTGRSCKAHVQTFYFC